MTRLIANLFWVMPFFQWLVNVISAWDAPAPVNGKPSRWYRLRTYVVRHRKAIAITVGGLAMLGTYWAQDQQRRREEERRPYGTLINSPLASHDIVAVNTLLAFADGATFYFADEPMAITAKDGAIKISTEIRDKDGKILVHITDNDWSVSHKLIKDRNFNENTLELIDDKGDPIFQLRLEGQNIFMAGDFYTKDGKGPFSFRPWLNEKDGRTGTLFEYPSERHPGKLRPIENDPTTRGFQIPGEDVPIEAK